MGAGHANGGKEGRRAAACAGWCSLASLCKHQAMIT